jgi:hypothetical protein
MHLVVNELTLENIAVGVVVSTLALAVQTFEFTDVFITVQVIRGFASAREQGKAQNK